MVHSSDSNLRLVPFLIAGALIGVAGVPAFGLVHAAVIVPIWTRLARGIPFAIVAGLTMGWALYELLRAFDSQRHRRMVLAIGFGVVLWITLVPMTLLGVALRAAGLHRPDSSWEVVAECAISASAGFALGRFIGGHWRPATALGSASLALTLTQAGPLSLLTSVRAARLFWALTVVYVLCGATLGPLASLLARRPRRRRALPVSS
jgi:hypothetical protein